MSDLVERLRDRAKRLGPSPNALLHFADGILPLLDEAATELASLRERVKELEGALYAAGKEKGEGNNVET